MFVYDPEATYSYTPYRDIVDSHISKESKINKNMRVFKGATEDEIVRLRPKVRQFGLDMPSDYIDFLFDMNGLAMPSFRFLGAPRASDECELTQMDFDVCDARHIVDLNIHHRQFNYRELRDRLLLGGSENYYFAYNQTARPDRRYERLFRDGWEVDHNFASVSTLLESTLSLKNVLGLPLSKGGQAPRHWLQ